MNPQKVHFRSHLFYGWYILVSSFIILFFISGARISFGVMFKPMISEFGWSRGSISFAFSLNMILFAFFISVVGRFYDRFGPKWVIIISTVFLSAGYGLISIIHSLWQLYLFYGILAGIGLGGTSLPLFASLMSKWFKKWRGLAISMALSGNSLGHFALIPLFTHFTIGYGWRTSYLLIGLIMFVINISLALWVIKGDPNDIDQRPFGDSDEERVKQRTDQIFSKEKTSDLNLWGAMHTSPFWLFVIVMFVCGSGDFFVTTHLIPFVTDHGISPITGGNMLAWLGLMSLAGILIAGPASDLIGNKIPLAIAFLLRFLSIILILKYQNITSFYIFALTFGFTLLITAPLAATLIGRLYGLSHIGLITGFVTTIHHLGGGFWTYLGGWIFDQKGSYQLIFILSAIMALIASFCSVFIREKRYCRT